MNNIIKDFRYVLQYYSLPRQINSHLGIGNHRGCTFSNEVTLLIHNDLKFIDIYNQFNKPEDQNRFDVLEAFHIYCLEL